MPDNPTSVLPAFLSLIAASRPLRVVQQPDPRDGGGYRIVDRRGEVIAFVPMSAFAQDWAETFVAAVNEG